jgi:hypothetical protein
MKKLTWTDLGAFILALTVMQTTWAQQDPQPGSPDPETIQLVEQIKIYPNPSNGQFQFQMDYDGKEKIEAKIYDITGKLILDITENLRTERSRVSANVQLNAPPSGIYFLRIEIGPKVLTKKLIIR